MKTFTFEKLKGIGLAVFSLSAVFLTACGGGGGGTSIQPTTSYNATQTPGDYWTFAFTGGNFTATNVTLNQTVSGTTKELTGNSEGFTELTTDAGDKAYALISPGIGLVAATGPFEWVDHSLDSEPADLQYLSKQPAIFGVSEMGSCDDLKNDLPFDFVGVDMPNAGWNSQTDWAAASGTMTFNSTTSKYETEVSHYGLDGNVIETSTVDGLCENGVVSFDVGESEQARVTFNTSGMFFTDDPSRGGMVGFKSDSSVAIEDAYGMPFLGMRYKSNYGYSDGSSSPETQPLKLTIAQDGASASVDFFRDIANGETEPYHDMPMSFGEQIVPGMIRGTATDADGMHNAIFVARKIDGKYQVITVSDNWYSYSGYNMFLIEK